MRLQFCETNHLFHEQGMIKTYTSMEGYILKNKRKLVLGTFLMSAILLSNTQSVNATTIEIPEEIPYSIQHEEIKVEKKAIQGIVEKIPQIENEKSIEKLILKEEQARKKAEEERIKKEKEEQARIAKEKEELARIKAEEERILKEKEELAKLSNADIAQLVIDGHYGNGDERISKLQEEGRDYSVIQEEVAKLTYVAPEIETAPSTNTGTESVQVQQVVNETPVSQGRTMTMEATGYSTQQPSLSRYTANGTDLIANPNVIAVDPSVIPLGSTVTVEGFGTFIAADTGSAIVGNRIDIHFTTVEGALNLGRRTVTVTVH